MPEKNRCILAALLVAISVLAAAQTPEFDLEKYNKFKKTKTAGIVLLCTSPLLFIGVASQVIAAIDDNPATTSHGNVTQWILISLTGATLVSGTALTGIGILGMRKYRPKPDGVHINMYVGPKQAGVVLSYRF